jgi:N,N'-diacetylchitobiose transport system permease protein
VTALPPSATVAAEAQLRRRRRFRRDHVLRALVPYSLISPATLVIGAVLGYPLYYLIRLSFQKYGLPELIQHKGVSVGLHNYGTVLHDHTFWVVVLRTVLFTAVNVVLTLVLGTLIAMLLARLGKVMRTVLTAGLVLVWSMPVVVAVQLWLWMTDYSDGIVNHVLGLGNHDWFANPYEGLAVVTGLIVWGAIPFVAITVYAGLAQVPGELVEAAEVDGAGRWRVFRDVTFPILKPIFVILASLSIIWDFQVFTQPFLLRFQRPTSDYYLMSIYAYEKSFGISEYGLGSAIALVMLLIVLGLSFFYIRQMVRIGDVR